MFKLTEEQKVRLDKWLADVNYRAVEDQKKMWKEDDPLYQIAKSDWEAGYPYTGAIGGGLTYMFTPTSLGLITKVQFGLTSEVIDLTDYENW